MGTYNIWIWEVCCLTAPTILPGPKGKILHKSVVSVPGSSMEPSWWGISITQQPAI